MDGCPPAELSGDIAAILEWWRGAGVDCAFGDAPRSWIAAPEPLDPAAPPGLAALPPAPPPRLTIGGDRALWPTELAAFAPWWLTEPSLDGGQVRERVPPRGALAAPLMILVAAPEAEDRDALLSGPQGRLLRAMLAAMGLGEEQVYLASALPRHTPMADWQDLAVQGLSDVLHHHLALALPQRIIAFGRHVSLLLARLGLESPLPGHNPTQMIPILPAIGHEGHNTPILLAPDLGALLERPIAKGRCWQQWLEWSAVSKRDA